MRNLGTNLIATAHAPDNVIEGIEIYSLYAHLSEVASGTTVGKSVKAGDVIATMGRTSNTSEHIGKVVLAVG